MKKSESLFDDENFSVGNESENDTDSTATDSDDLSDIHDDTEIRELELGEQ